MRRSIIITIMMIGLSQSSYGAPAITTYRDNFKAFRAKIEAATTSKTGLYAKEHLEKAKDTLVKAQLAADSGKEKLIPLYLELGEQQVKLAQTVAEERESLEKTAVRRSELVKLGEQLDRFLKGKEYPAEKISTISYGKERPVDKGHDETAWAKNRRDEFKIVK